MKTKKLIVSVVAAGCIFSLPLVYANDAPVEDLSVESPQPQAQAPVDNMDSSPAQSDDMNQSQDQQPQEQQLAAPSASTPASTAVQQDDNANMAVNTAPTGTNDERLARLEQQVSNMTNMNMPQQIEELRQEVQQLNGRIQVQQHDIKVLENQQRSFYQDLNRRIQQMANSGGLSMTQQQKAKVTTPVKSTVASAGLKDSAAYRNAFNLFVKKQYDAALSGFQDYTRQYPHGDFIANAYYWMGELYLKKNDTEMAEKSFSRIASQYPSSNKVPDAKLKLAIIHASQGKTQQAIQELKSIKRQYPNSTAAQLATIQLQRMNQ